MGDDAAAGPDSCPAEYFSQLCGFRQRMTAPMPAGCSRQVRNEIEMHGTGYMTPPESCPAGSWFSQVMAGIDDAQVRVVGAGCQARRIHQVIH